MKKELLIFILTLTIGLPGFTQNGAFTDLFNIAPVPLYHSNPWVSTFNYGHGDIKKDSLDNTFILFNTANYFALETVLEFVDFPTFIDSTVISGDCIIKLDSNDQLVWVKNLSDSIIGIPSSIDFDPEGNIYVSGLIFFENGNADTGYFDTIPALANISTNDNHILQHYIIKLNQQGELQWVQYGGAAPMLHYLDPRTAQRFNKIEYSNGHIYFYGNMMTHPNYATGQDYFGPQYLPGDPNLSLNMTVAAKLDTAGNFIWTRLFHPSNHRGLSHLDFHLDDQSNIYMAGITWGEIALDSNVITNLYDPNWTDQSVFLIKLNQHGNYLNHHSHEISFTSHNFDLKTIQAGNDFYFYNYTEDTLSIFPNSNLSKSYILKLDQNLNPVYGLNLNPPNGILLSQMETTRDGKILLGGGTRGDRYNPNQLNDTLTLGNKSLELKGNLFFAKIDTSWQNTDFLLNTENQTSQFLSRYHVSSIAEEENSYLFMGGGLHHSDWEFFGELSNQYYPNRSPFITRIVNCEHFDFSINAPDPVICDSGNFTTLEALGNPEIDYLWYRNGDLISGNSMQSINVSQPGNYLFVADSAGCKDTSAVVTVSIGQTDSSASVTPETQQVCENSEPLLLTGGSPQNGIWSGSGVVGDSMFVPDSVSIGIHELYYVYENFTGCKDSANRFINVQPLPQLFVFPLPDFCEHDSAYDLNPHGFPQGGTFTGAGIDTTGYFYPDSLGAGTYIFGYAYTNTSGCSDTLYIPVAVTQEPQVSFSFPTSLCNSDSAVALNATPAGGNWTGNGIVNNGFHPDIAGAGIHPVTYELTQVGCRVEATEHIEVAGDSILFAFQDTVCENIPAVQLSVVPSGGVFTGSGMINDSVFNPAAAGTGSHTLNYQVSGACLSDTASSQIHVQPAPAASLSALPDLCLNDSFLVLTQGQPAGEMYSGPGISNDTLFTQTAGAGNHNILYIAENTNGCSDTAVNLINIGESQPVSFHLPDSICVTASPVQFTQVSPQGGVFSGSGVTGTAFDPAAGIGQHTVTYTVSDSLGCTSADSTVITVYDDPDPQFNLPSTACTAQVPLQLAGYPAGGVFSGQGVSGNIFDPSIAGAGTHAVTYTVNGICGTKSKTDSIAVNTATAVSASLNFTSNLCLSDAPVQLTGGAPQGGFYTFSGDTVSTLDPSLYGSGIDTLTYYHTDSAGCTDTAQQQVNISPGLPLQFNLQDSACSSGGVIGLAAQPSGGSFAGTGVTGSQFDPTAAGVGNFAISYSLTDTAGCISNDTQYITVHDPIVAQWTAPQNTCESSAPVTLSGGQPTGGSFSGTGVSGKEFNPTAAGPGDHAVTYTVQSSCGTSSVTDTVTVYAAPQVSILSISDICIDEPPFTLQSGSPQGGNYSGPGVTAGLFDPHAAGTGTHNINYHFTDSNGCSMAAVTTITVLDTPQLSITQPDTVCSNTPVFTLNFGSPAGGNWFGMGVSGNTFDASAAGSGNHTLFYTDQNPAGCSDTVNTTITVLPSPIVSFNPIPDMCEHDVQQLSGGFPAAGYYSGPGVTGNTFNAQTAGAGTHTVYYVFQNQNGCADSAGRTFEVFADPNVQISNLPPVCEGDSLLELNYGNPSGGQFSGNYVAWNIFDPDAAGLGTHEIQYFYVDSVGCSGSDTQNITVHELPSVSIDSTPEFCANENPFELTGSPVNGTFSGTGVVNNYFRPDVALAGTHEIIYEAYSIHGCYGEATDSVTVKGMPAVDFNLPDSICKTDTALDLSGTLPYGGTFQGDYIQNDSFMVMNSTEGLHPIRYLVTDSHNCSYDDTFSIRVLRSPNLIYNKDRTHCSGYEYSFNVNGAQSYVWDHGPTTGHFTAVLYNDTSFSVTGYNYWGCSSRATINVTVLPMANVDAGNDTVVCLGDSVILKSVKPFHYYRWNGNNGDRTFTIHTGNYGVGLHEFALRAGFNAGCAGFDTVLVTVEACDTTGIQGLKNYSSEISVYPNPNAGNFNIVFDLNESRNFDATIITAEGKLVEKFKLSAEKGRNTHNINLEEAAAGKYFLIVKDDKGIGIKQIIIRR